MPRETVHTAWSERTFEAILLACGRPLPAEVDPRVEALRAAGVHILLIDDFDATTADQQLEPGPTEPGRPPGRSRHHWFRLAAASLAARGITGELVLIVCDGRHRRDTGGDRNTWRLVPELARAVAVSLGADQAGLPAGVTDPGGGTARFVELLDAQLARRRDRRVPTIDTDPAWVVALPTSPQMGRAAEAIGALSNGYVGSRAAREEDGPGTMPLFVANGVYTRDDGAHLLAGPVWTGLAIRGGVPDERLVDLRTGVLTRTTDTGVRTLRFVSAARPDALGLRAEGPEADVHSEPASPVTDDSDREPIRRAAAEDRDGTAITVAIRDRQSVVGHRRIVERLAAWVAASSASAGWNDAGERLGALEHVGFDGLLAEHREAWARRWSDAAVVIEGSADDELAARFAVFHLLGAAPDHGEAAVGARGLTGTAYGGHVFWDADVFVLPALAAISPDAARAMLEYRVQRLPAARAAAAAQGLRGARFPWESAGDGREVAPRSARGTHGEVIPIRTGDQEEHIVADVAWAASEYAAWTGDEPFLAGPGADLLVDTARYWASLVRVDHRGRGHLFGMMGPDEYHEVVDDNAYTNVMARWNLRRAADVLDANGGDAAEAVEWRRLAATLVDGWDPGRGLHEQFAGYWGLEPLLVGQFADPPVAADVLLGRERVAGSQLIKQADVLMLHHLVPDELVPGSLAADLTFYEPRTAHGSSLSAPIHAALFARAGLPERALELFRLAARLDLDDITGSTAAGLHLATMGGVWQALVYGFLGVRPRGELLHLDPCLPAAWQALSLRLRFRGEPIGVRAEHRSVTVSCTQPLLVRIAAGPTRRCQPPRSTFRLGGSRS